MLCLNHFLKRAVAGIRCVQRNACATRRGTGRRGGVLDLNSYTHDDFSFAMVAPLPVKCFLFHAGRLPRAAGQDKRKFLISVFFRSCLILCSSRTHPTGFFILRQMGYSLFFAMESIFHHSKFFHSPVNETPADTWYFFCLSKFQIAP